MGFRCDHHVRELEMRLNSQTSRHLPQHFRYHLSYICLKSGRYHV